MAHFEGKVVNHANREMLGRINILDDAEIPRQLLASVISLHFQENFSLKNIRKYKN